MCRERAGGITGKSSPTGSLKQFRFLLGCFYCVFRFSLGPPRFRQTPTNTTVKETGSAILECSASTPNTNITWYKDGKVVKKDGIQIAITRTRLIIVSAHLSNKGWYVCNATNRAGSKEVRAYLKVTRPLDAG